MVGYALALPPILISKRRARLSGDGARVIALRRSARVAFVLVITAGSSVFYAFYRHEQSRPVLTREELFTNSFDNAILHKDTQWMERLIAEGASVDHPLSLEQTPAVMSAEFGEWSLVLFLLNKGADPDKRDSSGLSVRSLAASPSRPVEKPSEKSALGHVRALLEEK
ncbi:MAG: ankyrin repeat domain-containing protein [Pseudomonas sp.]|nr:MAG: ankyrin repeat domain-containing protein [Pseudomonas sp.]